jgi:hypothetical protein
MLDSRPLLRLYPMQDSNHGPTIQRAPRLRLAGTRLKLHPSLFSAVRNRLHEMDQEERLIPHALSLLAGLVSSQERGGCASPGIYSTRRYSDDRALRSVAGDVCASLAGARRDVGGGRSEDASLAPQPPIQPRHTSRGPGRCRNQLRGYSRARWSAPSTAGITEYGLEKHVLSGIRGLYADVRVRAESARTT